MNKKKRGRRSNVETLRVAQNKKKWKNTALKCTFFVEVPTEHVKYHFCPDIWRVLSKLKKGLFYKYPIGFKIFRRIFFFVNLRWCIKLFFCYQWILLTTKCYLQSVEHFGIDRVSFSKVKVVDMRMTDRH